MLAVKNYLVGAAGFEPAHFRLKAGGSETVELRTHFGNDGSHIGNVPQMVPAVGLEPTSSEVEALRIIHSAKPA